MGMNREGSSEVSGACPWPRKGIILTGGVLSSVVVGVGGGVWPLAGEEMATGMGTFLGLPVGVLVEADSGDGATILAHVMLACGAVPVISGIALAPPPSLCHSGR